MNRVLVHNDNVYNRDDYEQSIKFNGIEDCLSKLGKIDFDLLYIKDVLTDNVLDFAGLILAYHIRLSTELGDKRFAPIVILSNLDGFLISKLSTYGQVLFTKNCYLNKTPKKITNLDTYGYTTQFLEKIQIDIPKDVSSNHDIANEWAIYLWAEALRVKNDAIQKNSDNIKQQLYFKYIDAKYQKRHRLQADFSIKKPTQKGKVLFVDDEWNKGWGTIVSKALQRDGLDFEVFEYDYTDKNWQIASRVMQKVREFDPDVVILDLRLSHNDQTNTDIDSFYGVKVLRQIKEHNPGIQVVMLTASSKSIVLEKLFGNGILGYVKKEHPEDINTNAAENINKFVELVDRGLNRKYLKDIWLTSQRLTARLDNDPFEKHFDGYEYLNYADSLATLKNEAKYIFDILNTNMDNNLNYALISLASSLDALKNIFIECVYKKGENRNSCSYLGNTMPEYVKSLNTYILYIIERMNHRETFKKRKRKLKELIDGRNEYIHQKPKEEWRVLPVTPSNILEWFGLLETIIQLIDEPKKKK